MSTLEVTHREAVRLLAFKLSGLGASAAAVLVAERSPIRWVSKAARTRAPRWKGLYLLHTRDGEVPGLVGVIEEPGTRRRAVAIVWWDDARGWRATANTGTLRGARRLVSRHLPQWALPPARPGRPSPASPA